MMLTNPLLLTLALAAAAPRALQVGAGELGPAGMAPVAAPLAEDPLEVSIEYITSIEYKKGKELPKDIRDLDGKTVMITGYMAIGTLEGATVFELVPESCECGRSKVQHFIEVSIESGGVTYAPGRVDLTGVFSVGEVEEDGFVTSLYRLKIETAP